MILAAGRGKSGYLKKPVISVGGEMLIERHIRKLAQTGYSEVIINVSYLADVIKQKVGYGERHGIRIIYSDEGNCSLNTGGGVKNALDKLGYSPFLLVSADVFTDWNFSTINLSQNVSGHLFLVKRSGEARENHFSIVDGKVVRDPVQGLVYAGIGVFRPQIFADIGKRGFPLREVLDCAALNKSLGGEVYDGCILDVGTVGGLVLIARCVCSRIKQFQIAEHKSLCLAFDHDRKKERVTMKSLMRLFARGFHACVLLVFRCVGWVTFASGRDAPCRFRKMRLLTIPAKHHLAVRQSSVKNPSCQDGCLLQSDRSIERESGYNIGREMAGSLNIYWF